MRLTKRQATITSIARQKYTTNHSLPVPPTPLIGREQEAAAALHHLRGTQVRLLTLAGPAGVGKTRLALQVAGDLLDDFADGIHFVDLASIREADGVLSAIARLLGLREGGQQCLSDLLRVYLYDKDLLLLLDNFEHLLPAAAPLVADLLARCPHVKVLITSREVLRVRAEQQLVVPPLALPDLKQLPESEAWPEYAAGRLFMQCVLAVKPDFMSTKAKMRAVAEICWRLDGLPLALELAASRIKLLSPQALLERLDCRLQILTQGPSDLPERQQTLHNLLTWSYDLLDVAEQQLFRRLAVFVGGCTLEAVEAVCAMGGDGETTVLERVTSLLDKSLLQHISSADGQERLLMLETIREYGWECLQASGEMEAIQQAHAAYYLALTEKAEPELQRAQQVIWLERVGQEYKNLSTAFEWLLKRAETEKALRLSGALGRFWLMCGYISEGQSFLERALAGKGEGGASIRAKALFVAARLAICQNNYSRVAALNEEIQAVGVAWTGKRVIAYSLLVQGFVTRSRGDHMAACTLYAESLRRFRAVGDHRGSADVLSLVAEEAMSRADYVSGRALVEESLALFRALGDHWSTAVMLFFSALIALHQGDYAAVRTQAEESLVICRELGNQRDIPSAGSLCCLGKVAFHQGDYPAARILAEESLMISRESGYRWGIAGALGVLGEVALQQGDDTTASSLLAESLTLFRELKDVQGIARGLAGLGCVAFSRGDAVTAAALYEELLKVLEGLGDKQFLGTSLEALGSMVAEHGQPLWAARLWGTAEALGEASGTPCSSLKPARYECAVTAARTQLGEESFVAAWAEGRTMTPAQALAARKQASTLEPALAVSHPSVVRLSPAPIYPDNLTAREVEVLRLLAQGWSDAQIAEHLVISLRTVNAHTTSIYRKIQVCSRSAATRYAIEQHLV